MARPKVPLISRRAVFEKALSIIDLEGLEALSTRRLGLELGVNGTSLYYHFKTMDEIVAGAAGLALSDVRTPTDQDATWRDWLPENALRTRRALLQHPRLIPVLMDRRRLGIGERSQEETVRRLIAEGVPRRAVMPLMLSLELFAIGSALHEAQNAAAAAATSSGEAFPDLAQARADSGLVGEELLRVIIASVMDAVMCEVAAEAPSTGRSAERPAAVRKARSRKPSTAG